jgi:hypothetical protein
MTISYHNPAGILTICIDDSDSEDEECSPPVSPPTPDSAHAGGSEDELDAPMTTPTPDSAYTCDAYTEDEFVPGVEATGTLTPTPDLAFPDDMDFNFAIPDWEQEESPPSPLFDLIPTPPCYLPSPYRSDSVQGEASRSSAPAKKVSAGMDFILTLPDSAQEKASPYNGHISPGGFTDHLPMSPTHFNVTLPSPYRSDSVQGEASCSSAPAKKVSPGCFDYITNYCGSHTKPALRAGKCPPSSTPASRLRARRLLVRYNEDDAFLELARFAASSPVPLTGGLK